jgi:hypothetical protein
MSKRALREQLKLSAVRDRDIDKESLLPMCSGQKRVPMLP